MSGMLSICPMSIAIPSSNADWFSFRNSIMNLKIKITDMTNPK